MSNSRGRYSLPFTVTNPTTAPFLQLATPAGTPLKMLEFFVGQEASETAEQVAMTIMRRTTASTLPTAGTIVKLDPNDAATQLTSSTTTNAYGIASVTGTAGDLIMRLNYDSRVGILYAPSMEELAITMDVSQFLTFQFTAAPAANTYSGYVFFAER